MKIETIDWGSRNSYLLVNPRLPAHSTKNLNLEALPDMREFVWIGSSGSTGSSESTLKLFGLSKAAFLISAEAVNAHIASTHKDIWLNVLPLFHVGGVSIYARAYLSSSRVTDRSSLTWSAEGFHLWVNESKATLTSLVPTQLFDLVKLGKNAPPSLRVIFVGGAQLDEQLYQNARRLNYPVLPTYGMTECCSQIATAPLNSLSLNLFPQLNVLLHMELKVVEGGFLAIKTPALFAAQVFWHGQRTENQAEVLWRAGQWFMSEDRGSLSGVLPNQFVKPIGRDLDQVKISGELVQLNALRALMQKESGGAFEGKYHIFAQHDLRRGVEIAIAYTIELQSEIERFVQKLNAQVLPVAKICAGYLVPKLPLTELGKIKDGELKKSLGL